MKTLTLTGFLTALIAGLVGLVPPAVQARPGVVTFTDSNAPAIEASINLYVQPTNPNTTNSITDVSGTGASVTVIGSHLEQ